MPDGDVFSDIIGHESALAFLRSALARETVSQAYCFSGPRGVGKRAVAERLVRALLGVANLETHPDAVTVIRLPERKDISVEQIRELRSRLQLGSFLNSWKVAIIDDAEMLSPSAANALLKTLEEPSGRTVTILVTAGLDALPATIRSRCQIVRFRLVPDVVVARGLERRGLVRRDAESMAAVSFGRPGVAVQFAANPEARAAREELMVQAAALLTGPLHERLRAVETVLDVKAPQPEQAETLVRALRAWSDALRQALAVSLGIRESVDAAPALTAWARASGPARLAAGLTMTENLKNLLRKNVNPRLCLEQFVLSFAS